MKIGVCNYIHRYKETGMISLMPEIGKASKFTADAKKIIEEQIEKDDETIGEELQKLLAKNDIQVASLKRNCRVAPPYADKYIILGKMHKQFTPPLWPNLLKLALLVGVSSMYLVHTCYTRCIIMKCPFAYVYYTHTRS